MLIYKERNTFLQGLHPFTAVFLLLEYLIVFLLIKNPVYLFVILLTLLFLAAIDGCLFELLKYGKIIFPFAILLMIINPLIVHDGNTVLYQGHFNIPVLGSLRITLEALIFGIFNGIRIICITIVLGFGNLVIHPDKSFGFFSKYLKKSALLMSMTIRFFPTMMKSYTNIKEIEKLRGNTLANKSFIEKIKSQGNIVNILFASSLEDSSDMAESMYSRGYGIGKRSSYFNLKMSLYDFVLIFITGAEVFYTYLFISWGLNNIKFYPAVDNFLTNINIKGIILVMFFFGPLIINWWWKHWKY